MCQYTYHHYPGCGHISSFRLDSCYDVVNGLRFSGVTDITEHPVTTRHDLISSEHHIDCYRCEQEKQIAIHFGERRSNAEFTPLEGSQLTNPLLVTRIEMPGLDIKEQVALEDKFIIVAEEPESTEEPTVTLQDPEPIAIASESGGVDLLVEEDPFEEIESWEEIETFEEIAGNVSPDLSVDLDQFNFFEQEFYESDWEASDPYDGRYDSPKQEEVRTVTASPQRGVSPASSVLLRTPELPEAESPVLPSLAANRAVSLLSGTPSINGSPLVRPSLRRNVPFGHGHQLLNPSNQAFSGFSGKPGGFLADAREQLGLPRPYGVQATLPESFRNPLTRFLSVSSS